MRYIIHIPVTKLQSWTKVLVTVLQHSFLGSLLKRCILFENFLQFSLPPPYTKLKLEKILDTRVHCLRGEGRGWTCVNWQTPQKCKGVPRLRISNLTISADLHGLLVTFGSWRISSLKKPQAMLSKTLSLNITRPYNFAIPWNIWKFYMWKAKATSKTQQLNVN